MTNFECDCCVVGAGPAGLMAAIATASRGLDTIVLEKLPAPGRRLLATGGGRCNLANTLPPKECSARFGRRRGFVSKSIGVFPAEKLREFLDRLGVPTSSSDGFHVFPSSQKASEVLDALIRECQRLGVRIETQRRACQVLTESGRAAGLAGQDFNVHCASVILAPGGLSCPALGGGDDFIRLSDSAGHSCVPSVPALVGLDCHDEWLKSLAGVVLKDVDVELIDASGARVAKASGDLLFTGSGVSGPPVLDISGAACRLLQSCAVCLRLGLAGGKSADAMLEVILDWQKSQPRRTLRSLAAELAPRSVADAIFSSLAIALDLPAARLSKNDARRLAAFLSGAVVSVSGASGGFSKAMATHGGIDTSEVDPATLGSRLLPGLFFAGEALDVDGPCGGFNLQWAFSSGRLAGLSAT